MIVVLSRGAYCPNDRRQLRNLVELAPELKVAYTKVVTISTDNLLECATRGSRRSRTRSADCASWQVWHA